MSRGTANNRSRIPIIKAAMTITATVALGIVGICTKNLGKDRLNSSESMIGVGLITAVLAMLSFIKNEGVHNSIHHQDTNGLGRAIYIGALEGSILCGLLMGATLNGYQLQQAEAENRQKDWHTGLNASMIAILGVSLLARLVLFLAELVPVPESPANSESAPFFGQLRTSEQARHVRFVEADEAGQDPSSPG